MLGKSNLGSTHAMSVEMSPDSPSPDVHRRIREAAERARSEAEARRKRADGQTLPREIDGRSGPEPVRYGDWESKGLACDF
jgi:hypothetical protein